jgi:hypothetical protein
MKKILWVLLVLIVGVACKNGVPGYIIKPTKMEQVLYDIHIVDAYLSNISSSDSVKKVAAAYYDGIYKKFDIDSVEYTISLNYYYAHPDLLEDIYKKISVKVGNQSAIIKRADSLANAKTLRAHALIEELKADSSAINVGYNLETAKNILFVPRYKYVNSENSILFNITKYKLGFDYSSIKDASTPNVLTPITTEIDKPFIPSKNEAILQKAKNLPMEARSVEEKIYP